MKFRQILILSAGFIFLFSSCFLSKKNSHKKALSENERVDFAFNFFEASKHKMLGNTEQALNFYLQCIRIDGKSDAAMYEAALLLAAKGKFDNAVYFMRGASSLQPENIWYQLTLAELYQKNKSFNEAVAIFEKLIKKYPDHADLYFDWAESYLYAGKFSEAIKVYDKLEILTGVTAEISIQKKNLFLKLGKFDKAVEELQKLIASNPEEAKYYGLLAELYQANGMNEKALEVLTKAESISPDNPYLHFSKAEYYRAKGEKEKSFSELKIAFSSKKLDLDTKISVLSSYYTLLVKFPELKDQALELNRILIETHSGDSRAFAVYGDFLYQDEKTDEARTQYRKALELDKQSFTVWQQLLRVEGELRDYEAMITESEEAITLFPSQAEIYYYNGVAKIQAKKEVEGIAVLNRGIKLIVDDDRSLAEFYANIGDAYNRLKNYPESDKAYDMSVKLDPKKAYTLNNYSYYLSLRSDSLDKAEKMSLLSNQLEPKNSSFQDTYAWILYKQGNYSDAKLWLEKAMVNGGDKNPVILEHYGDSLWRLGMTDKALEFWQKARDSGNGSDFLDKKIVEKKLLE